MFTKQHYQAISDIVNREYTRFDNTGENDYEGKHAIACVTSELANYFKQDNPRFDKSKFMKACGFRGLNHV